MGRYEIQVLDCYGNPTYPDIVLKEEQILQIWGVVTSVIKVLPA